MFIVITCIWFYKVKSVATATTQSETTYLLINPDLYVHACILANLVGIGICVDVLTYSFTCTCVGLYALYSRVFVFENSVGACVLERQWNP